MVVRREQGDDAVHFRHAVRLIEAAIQLLNGAIQQHRRDRAGGIVDRVQVGQIIVVSVHFIQDPFQDRRDDADGVDLLLHKAAHVGLEHKLRHQHHGTAGRQRQVRANRRGVEQLGNILIALSVRVGIHAQRAAQLAQHGAVRLHHALGMSRRAAGMQMAGLVFETHVGDHRPVRHGGDHIAHGRRVVGRVDLNKLDFPSIALPELLIPFRLLRLVERAQHAVQIQHISHLFRRQAPVDLYRDGAHFVNGKLGNQAFRAVAGNDRHRIALFDAQALQIMRRLADHPAELTVCDAPVSKNNCLPVRAASDRVVHDLAKAGIAVKCLKIHCLTPPFVVFGIRRASTSAA